MSDLIERLRGKWPAGGLRNVDDPKAADQLEAQQAEIARLREALGQRGDGGKWSSQDSTLKECWGIGALEAPEQKPSATGGI